ncbi:MAG: hypothetical protein KDI59_11290 [Xanthomonadales bacterium]|jgi:hypothetical protein|nr:hypothetical protein [Xanthomonadales bacterium]MCB1605225.1 hypothetical protein [Xanthomonadales bacterium]
MDNEAWLIEIGDEIIEKKANSSYEDLNNIEQSIYCFWVIDYAVRNSGTLEPMKELHPSAIEVLLNNAQFNNWSKTINLLNLSNNEKEFCSKYYEQFEMSCNELRSAYENT